MTQPKKAAKKRAPAKKAAKVAAKAEPNTATNFVRKQVKRLRNERGWSAKQLAERLKGLGIPWDRDIVANFENGRRASISLEETLALAYALDIAPAYFIIPDDNDQLVDIARQQVRSINARSWLAGFGVLPGTDQRRWRLNQPPTGLERMTEDEMVTKMLNVLDERLTMLSDPRADEEHDNGEH